VGSQRRRVRDPDVGQAIGQQQAAVDALPHQVTRDLFAATHPSASQVRGATGLDLGEAPDRGVTGFPRRLRGLDHDVHRVVMRRH
jgi:hypothetical protein